MAGGITTCNCREYLQSVAYASYWDSGPKNCFVLRIATCCLPSRRTYPARILALAPKPYSECNSMNSLVTEAHRPLDLDTLRSAMF